MPPCPAMCPILLWNHPGSASHSSCRRIPIFSLAYNIQQVELSCGSVLRAERRQNCEQRECMSNDAAESAQQLHWQAAQTLRLFRDILNHSNKLLLTTYFSYLFHSNFITKALGIFRPFNSPYPCYHGILL